MIKYQNALRLIKDQINKICDLKTRQICTGFFNDELSIQSENSIASVCCCYKKVFKQLASISIDNIDDSFIFESLTQKREISAVWLKLFKYAYEKCEVALFDANRHKYCFLSSHPNYELYETFKRKENKPELIIYSERPNSNSHTSMMFKPKNSNQYISELISIFISEKNASSISYKFPCSLAEYLYSNKITNINEQISDSLIEGFLNYDIDNRDNNWLGNAKEFFIWVLKSMPVDDQIKKCPLYRIQVLNKASFGKYFLKGARPVLYNRFDPVPTYDIWFLMPNGDQKGTTQLNDSSVITVDFTKIINDQMRTYAKHFVWYGTNNIATKVKDCTRFHVPLNMLFPNKNSIYKEIESSKCASYKTYITNAYSKTETRNSFIYTFGAFIKYIDQNNLIKVDKNCYLYLNNRGSLNTQGAKCIKKDELVSIAKFFDEHKNDSILDLQLYVIFHISLNTEFRISQIVNLTTDCVQQSLKKNEYVIISNTKVSGYHTIEQPCAQIIKKIIDDYLEASANYREECPDQNLKKYLFLIKDSYNGVYSLMDRGIFSKKISEISKSLNIGPYSAKNLRATFITNAKEYVIKNNLSDMTLLGITGHRNVDTINNHYIQEKIRDALQATNNIIIGEIDINGKIVGNPNSIKSGKDILVENECGYCQSEFCDSNGPLSCLLCKHFATTLDRIPFFKKQIVVLDKIIQDSKNPHDVEDAVNLKRLFARYLESLITLKEEQNGNQ